MRATDEARFRWVPVVAVVTVLGIGCALLGAYFVAPLMGGRALPGGPPPAQMASVPAGSPARPPVVFPSGQNAVRIEEKPVTPPAPPAPKEEPGITTSIESAPDDTGSGEAGDEAASKPRQSGHRGKRDSAGQDTAAGAASPAGKDESAPHSDGDRTESPGGASSEPAPDRGAGAAEAATPASAPASGPDATSPASGAPGTASPTSTAGLFRVQVGRFAEERDAQALKEELGRMGYAPTVVRTGRDGQTLFRVQVGTFRRRENADKTMEQLRQRQFEPYLAEDEP
jgi:cell division septation protein DedD